MLELTSESQWQVQRPYWQVSLSFLRRPNKALFALPGMVRGSTLLLCGKASFSRWQLGVLSLPSNQLANCLLCCMIRIHVLLLICLMSGIKIFSELKQLNMHCPRWTWQCNNLPLQVGDSFQCTCNLPLNMFCRALSMPAPQRVAVCYMSSWGAGTVELKL